MIKIGITGSIAMGKSTIARTFKMLSVPIHDSDLEAKYLIEKNKYVFNKIKKNWPQVIYKGNIVNKLILREIIFSNKSDKLKLEKIIHPLITKSKKDFENFYKNKKQIIAFDIPLLYETNQKNEYDHIFLAVCKEETQERRALRRKNLSVEIFEKIKKSQLTVKQKVQHKPIVINTDYPKFVNFVTILYKILCIRFKLV